MKRFCKNMMNIFFADLVINLTADFQIRTDIAFPKTMISLKKNLICKTMLNYITLNNFQHIFISPCKTGTSQTNNNFTAMIH